MPPATRKTLRNKRTKVVSPAKKKTRSLVKSKATTTLKKKSKQGQALKAWWDEKKKKAAAKSSSQDRELKVCLERLKSPKKTDDSNETPPQCDPLVTDIKEEEEEVHIDDVHQENVETSFPNTTTTQVPAGYLLSELLPGLKGEKLYYDGGGFYYRQTFEDDSQRWLQCIHIECDVEAHMQLYEGAPIITTEDEKHSHKPNTSRRDRVWFLHHLTTRNKAEDIPFSVIFQEEAAKNPVGASFFTLEKIEKHLQKKKSSAAGEGVELNTSEASGFNPKILFFESKLNVTPERPKGALKRGNLTLETEESKKRKIDHNLSQKICENPKILDLENDNQSMESNQQLQLSESPVGSATPNAQFNDEHGYHYLPYSVNKRTRYLRCKNKGCEVRAKMGLQPNAQICLSGKTSHNHPSQVPPLAPTAEKTFPQTPTTGKIPPLTPITGKGSSQSLIAGNIPSKTPITENIPPLTPIAGISLLPASTQGALSHSPAVRKVSPTVHKKLIELQKPAISPAPLGFSPPVSQFPLGFINPNPDNVGNKTTMPPVLLVPMTLNSNKMNLAPVVIGPGSMNIGQVASTSSAMGLQFVTTQAVSRTSLSPVVGSCVQVVPLNTTPTLPKPVASEQLIKPTSKKKIQPKIDDGIIDLKVIRPYESEIVPGFLHDSWLYHDLKGHYYLSRGVHKHKRLLVCAYPMCSVRAWMEPTAGAVIHTLFPHLHPPCPPSHKLRLWLTHQFRNIVQQGAFAPQTTLETLYSREFKKDTSNVVPFREMVRLLEASGLKSTEIKKIGRIQSIKSDTIAETIPSSSYDGGVQYYDGDGFYYKIEKFHKATETRYLKCATSSLCPGRAATGLKSPITRTISHNHQPNPDLRDIYVFIDTLKTRARNDLQTSVSIIYTQEANRNPKAAEKLDEESVVDKLLQIRNSLLTPEVIKLNVYFGGDNSLEKQYCSNAETLQGCRIPVYYNGKGFYFIETFSDPLTRFLICCEPNCLAQAQMSLTDQDSIYPLPNSEPHNHRADFYRYQLFKMMENIYRSVDPCSSSTVYNSRFSHEALKFPIVAAQVFKRTFTQMVKSEFKKPPRGNREDIEILGIWETEYQAERLPNFRTRDWIYYDGRGYFYYSRPNDKAVRSLFLVCCIENCDATAYILVDKYPETISRQPGCLLHNHEPDKNKALLLRFLLRVLNRIQRENHCLPKDIFLQELILIPKDAVGVVAKLSKEKCLEILSQLTVHKLFLDEKNVSDMMELFVGDCMTEVCDVLWSYEPKEQVYCLAKNGYYYTEVKRQNTKRYLKCLAPLCKAVATFSEPTLQNQIKIPSSSACHNHPPDFEYIRRLRMISGMREKAINSDIPIDTIFSEYYKEYEQGNNTERFNSIDEINLKNMMYKFRKTRQLEIPEEEAIGVFTSSDDEMQSKITSDDLYSYFEEIEKLYYENLKKPTDSGTTSSDRSTDVKITQIQKKIVEPIPENCHKMKVPRIFPVKKQPNKYVSKSYTLLHDDNTTHENSKVKELQVNSVIAEIRQQEQVIPEKIPYRVDNVIYFDPQGYYFLPTTVNQEKQMYLHCIEPKCRVWAWISQKVDNAPMVMVDNKVAHNHNTDFLLRKKLLFEHRVMEYVLSDENASLEDVWSTEAELDPETAKEMTNPVKVRLSKYRFDYFKEKRRKESTPAKEVAARVRPLSPDPERKPTRVDLDKEQIKIVSTHINLASLKVPSTTEQELNSKEKMDVKHTQDNVVMKRRERKIAPKLTQHDLNIAIAQAKQDLYESKVIQDLNIYERKTTGTLERTSKSPGYLTNSEIKKKKLRKCSFTGCDVTTQNSPDTHLFGFPVNRPEICNEWIENCANKQLLGLSPSVLQVKKVCSNHFKEICFTNKTRSFLKKDAVPTLLNCNSVLPEDNTSEDETPLESRISTKKIINPLKKKLIERAKLWNKARLKCLSKRKELASREELNNESSSEKLQTSDVKQSSSTLIHNGTTAHLSLPSEKEDLGPSQIEDKEENYIVETLDDEYTDYVTLEDAEDSVTSQGKANTTKNVSNEANADDRLSSDVSSPNEVCPGNSSSEITHSLGHKINDKIKIPELQNYDSTPLLKDIKGLVKFNEITSNVTKVKKQETSSLKISTPRPMHNNRPKIGPKSVMAADEESEEDEESNEGNYIVETLDDDYTDYVTLEDAEDSVTSKKDALSHECRYCGNSFSSNIVLLAHIKERHFLSKHESERPSPANHKCDQCNRVFPSKHNLLFHKSRGHVSTSTEEPPPDSERDALDHTLQSTNENLSIEEPPPDSERDALDDTLQSTNENQVQQEEEVKSERVPSFRANGVVFYDGKGYYYTTDIVQNSKRYLKCVDKTCEGRAVMNNYEGAPIVNTVTTHSHEPNPNRQKYYRFLKRCCDRAVTEKKPVHDIYKQEADKDPGAAPQPLRDTVISRMVLARNSALRNRVKTAELKKTEYQNKTALMSEEISENDIIEHETTDESQTT